jgi:hypothetical protein
MGKTKVWPREGTQAAKVAAREIAAGSPKGETSGSERVNIPERSRAAPKARRHPSLGHRPRKPIAKTTRANGPAHPQQWTRCSRNAAKKPGHESRRWRWNSFAPIVGRCPTLGYWRAFGAEESSAGSGMLVMPERQRRGSAKSRGARPPHSVQSSIFKSFTRWNSSILLVRRIKFLLRAIAAIIRSLGPIKFPLFSKSARMCP